MPSSRIPGSYDISIVSFLRKLHSVLHSGCINLHFKITGLARRFFPESVLKQDTLLLYNPKECREKAMAPHSSTLAWKIPWTEEPGGPQSMGSLGVGHD